MDKEQPSTTAHQPANPLHTAMSLPSTLHILPPDPNPHGEDSVQYRNVEISALRKEVRELKSLIFSLGRTVQTFVDKAEKDDRLPACRLGSFSLPPGLEHPASKLKTQGTQTSEHSFPENELYLYSDSSSEQSERNGVVDPCPNPCPNPRLQMPYAFPVCSNAMHPVVCDTSYVPSPSSKVVQSNEVRAPFLKPLVSPNPHAFPVHPLLQPHPYSADTYAQSFRMSTNIQSRVPSHRHLPGPLPSHPPQHPPNPSKGLSRPYHVSPPSFPSLTLDDPKQFVMLKMALSNLVPPDESEQFKYHLLLDHLKLDTAHRLALAYAHHPLPYTQAMAALQKMYGQPQRLVLHEISAILNFFPIHPSDPHSFSDFAIHVRALVGLLQCLEGGEGDSELACASHVQQLLGKLPSEHVANYARYSGTTRPGVPYNLIDFANWLEEEAECYAVATQCHDRHTTRNTQPKPHHSSGPYSRTSVLYGTSCPPRPPPRTFYCHQSCAFCAADHHLSICPGFRQLSSQDVQKWIREENRCWRCARNHKSADCDLRRTCPKCKKKHLGVLHDHQSAFTWGGQMLH